MADESVNCVVTSPPYFGLRDYGTEAQIGLEETPEAFVAELVSVFREVRRVLRGDGTMWLNIGDSYTSMPRVERKDSPGVRAKQDLRARKDGGVVWVPRNGGNGGFRWHLPGGQKPKDLIGIPWMVAFALRADGWYLRQDIIWSKPNPMPESVTDRPTKAHEYLFLLSKSARYFWDADAVRESITSPYSIARNRSTPRNFGVRGEFNADRQVGASFLSIPGAAFTVNGARPARDAALVSAGVDVGIGRNVTVYAQFDSELAGSGNAYAGSGGLRVSW